MSLILKSNQVSTRNLGNIFGITTALDYSAMLDFSNEIYRVKESGIMVEKDISEVISVTRSTPALVFRDGSIKSVPANQPKIHFDNTTGTKGLLVEDGLTNLATNPEAPATQVISIARDGVQSKGVVMRIVGTGTATFSGTDASVNSVATEENVAAGIVYPGAGSVNLTITISGDVQRLMVFSRLTPYGSVSRQEMLPIGLTTSSHDDVKLLTSVNNGEGTIMVVGTLAPRYGGQYENATILAIGNTANSGGLFLRRAISAGTPNGGFLGDFVNSSNALHSNINKAVSASNKVSMAFAFSGTKANKEVAFNGMMFQLNNDYTFTHDNVKIGSGNLYSYGGGFNGIIQRVVVWDRKLTSAEIIELTGNIS